MQTAITVKYARGLDSGFSHIGIVSYFPQKTGLTLETTYMKCQIVFSGKKIRKLSSVCRLLNWPSILE